MTWSPLFSLVTPGPTSTTIPAPSWPRIEGKTPSGSAPERVNSSVWQMPVALISTSTSPAFGPSRRTVSIASGAPALWATAARTSILFSPRVVVMTTDAGGTLNSMSRGIATSWRKLLAEPGENGHIVQLYQDDEFYGEAISHFAAEGLARGESIILVATEPHWKNISARLRGKGFNLEELFGQGQLTLLDADATLPKFMRGNTPDAGIFKPLAKQTIDRARAEGRYPRVRW